MKRVFTGVLSLMLIAGLHSCKDAENADNEPMEESHDEGSHDHYDDTEDDHEHEPGEMHGDDMQSGDMNKKMQKSITVSMSAKSGSDVSGNIDFMEEDGQVTMKVNLMGLSEGEHAIHIHETGDCSSDDGKSAGGHWNPSSENHGKWNTDAFHMGDIGNMEVGADGKATMTFKTDKWCLGCDDNTKNIMDKAVIVHGGADDFKSQPSGAAGKRVACGVIK